VADKEVLFVYGSLMRGLANHDVLASADFIGQAVTRAQYSLLDLGPYPGAVGAGTQALRGEIYAVTRIELARLDAFEGVPSFYRRVRTQLEQPEGSAWIYLLTSLPAGVAVVHSGSWRQHLQER
jgi:gamma-glutamylcyclotransferase (GGCT)/AIG2-like uncharacterized protein YtfP